MLSNVPGFSPGGKTGGPLYFPRVFLMGEGPKCMISTGFLTQAFPQGFPQVLSNVPGFSPGGKTGGPLYFVRGFLRFFPRGARRLGPPVEFLRAFTQGFPQGGTQEFPEITIPATLAGMGSGDRFHRSRRILRKYFSHFRNLCGIHVPMNRPA